MSKIAMALFAATARNAVSGKTLALIVAVLANLVMPLATLHAQTFAPVEAVAFTKVFAGANPLPQILTFNSTGASFNYTYSSSTSTGGNWLSVSPINGCGSGVCSTPHVLMVTVNPGASLAAGNYNGQIVVTSYPSASVSMTVPVTLTIMAPGTPSFDNLPGQVSFSFKTAGSTPPPHTIQIRNAGSGTLNWTRTVTTSDGGNWLSVSAASGTAPSSVNISLVKANLPGAGTVAGTFTGQLLFQASGSGSVTIPVSVVVGDPVFSQVNGISFTKLFAGADPLPQTLTMPSTGTTFNFTVEKFTGNGGDWLDVVAEAACGSGVCPTPHGLTVRPKPAANLAAGTYTGQIVLTLYVSGAWSMTIPVSLTVVPPDTPFFDNVPGQLSFSFKTGGVAPPEQLLDIRNGSLSGFLDWTLTASTSDGGNWLTVSAPNGTAPSQVVIGISKPNLPNAGLVAGTFVGQLVFRAAGSSVTVPISVTVGDAVFRQVNGLYFTKLSAGADPLPQTMTINSTGAAFTFLFTASTATGGDWLDVTAEAACGSGVCLTPHTFTVAAKPAVNLPAGTYTGQIVVTSYPSGAIAMTVPVTLTIASATTPFFDSLPGQLSFSLKTGASTPPPQSVQVRNGGSGTLNWTLTATTSDGGNWLNISAPNGTAPSLVTVSIVKANLPDAGLVAGTFIGWLRFQTGGGSVTLPVAVVVGDSVFSQVNGINFTKPFSRANPLPQTLTIPSTGANFNFVVASSTSTGDDWLDVTAESACGSGVCLTPHTLTVTAKPAVNLPAGTYTGQIVLTAYPSGAIAMTIPVTLTIAPPATPFFDNVQGQMSFSTQPTGTNPASHSVQLRNGGSGTLTWTLEAITSDGGNWLSASASSGTAPSTVTVNVAANLLPGNGLVPGTFVGLLTFRSAGSSVTVPVSVTIGTSVFSQLGSLTFTKPFSGANPLSQNISIGSTGAAFFFVYTESTGTGGDWLTLSVASGCGSGVCTTPQTLTVGVNPAAGLAAGTYTGQIVVTAYPSGSMAMTIPVYLNVTPPVCTITATSGSGQSTLINTPFANPLVATVKDANNNPCSSVTVTFSPPGSGASGTFAGGTNTATTNAQGVATSAVVTANGTTGAYNVTATASGIASPANFALTNTPAVPLPPTITTTSGSGQSATIGTAFANRLVATVRDGSNNPLSGVTVTFSAPATGASGAFAGGVNTAVTNAQGQATSAVFTANGTIGGYNVTATAPMVVTPASFSLTNAPSCVTSITPSADTAPPAGRNSSFAIVTAAGCAWTASSSQSWLEIFPLTGTNSGNITWTVYPNFGTATRTATATVGNKTFTVTQTASTETLMQRFVRLLYFSYLGRAASNAEVAGQVNSGLSRTQLATNFLNSAEFNLGGRFTAGLYVGIMDRDAEFTGWQFQRQALARGAVNQDQLVSNFLNSAEFALKFGALTNSDFVRLMYRNVLLREAAPNEVNAWLNVLANPANTRTIIARSFLNSPEFQNGTGPRLLAFLLYATLLLRDPTSAERSALEAILADPAQLPAQINLFANGAEINALLQ